MELENNPNLAQKRLTLREQVIQITDDVFEPLALAVFQYQAVANPIYSKYLNIIGTKPALVDKLSKIPFLPIQFFKNHVIQSGTGLTSHITFESSGTTGSNTSRHHLYDPELYHQVAKQIFENQYGSLSNFHIIALLPSYLERSNASLVYMVDLFIKETGSPYSGFYLTNYSDLVYNLKQISKTKDGKKILILGVTFALLDIAESNLDLGFLKDLEHLIVMDTGGMKGRRKEMLREEVHDILISQLKIDTIHSEYGMTELLSQGYSTGGGLFCARQTLRILLREINDPFSIFNYASASGKTGGINVIDLANLDSCSFIETQDLGRYGHEPDSFYVMGRFDNSDIRGCNLLI